MNRKKPWSDWLPLGANIALGVMLIVTFVAKGAKFEPPWDGPAIVTILLAVATIVLAAVALGVGLLAVWGYTSLREHAGHVADRSAAVAADKAVEKLLREWGWQDIDVQRKLESGRNEDIANVYGKEG